MAQQSSSKSCRLLASHAAASIRTAMPLADDLVFDVLARLPVKSVCRFRCVSTGWDALVSDPAFVAAHKSRHTEPLLVVTSQRDGHGECDLRLMDMAGNIVRTSRVKGGTRLISTGTDDLVCFTDRSGGARVIDPATGEVLVDLVTLKVPRQRIWWLQYNNVALGFGRAVSSNAYKLVSLVNGGLCQVLTLGDGAGWRSSSFPKTYSSYNLGPLVSVNGFMYFLLLWVQPENSKLLCFDIENEEWKSDVEGPPEVLVSWKMIELVRITELNDSLCMLQPERPGDYYEHVNIWLLTDSNKSTWIRAYTISLAPFTYEFTPLRVIPDVGKLIVYCSVHKQGGVLQVYDPDTKACTTLRKLDYVVDRISLCSLHLDRLITVQNLLRTVV